jgi:alkane 1-monooxygenase
MIVMRLLLFLPFTIPLIFLQKLPIVYHTNWWWTLQAVIYVYATAPLLDLIGGEDRGNVQARDQGWIGKALEYAFLPRILFIKILLLKALMLEIVASGRVGTIDAIAIAFLTGQIVGSYGIFIAHELVHRKSRLDKALAEILMVTAMYPHFCIEHLYGHHKYAATRLDPATSRFGENVYAFLPRSIFGGVAHAWQLEVRRMRRRGLGALDPRNRMLRYLAEVILLNLAVYYLLGGLAVAALLVQGLVAITTLEVVNYVQHYGLERREITSDVHEPTDVAHSWNSEFRFSNGYWLNLGRHSDHHYAVNRGFQMLRHFENEPMLPAGLPTMFLVALIPPLWFKLMNPRVEQWRKEQRALPAQRRGGQDAVSGAAPDNVTARPRHGIATVVAATAAPPAWPDRYGGIILFASIGAFIGLDLMWGTPTGFIFIAVLSVIIAALRHGLGEAPSPSAATGAASR